MYRFEYSEDRLRLKTIPPYCAAVKEYDSSACSQLYINYRTNPEYFNRGEGSAICRSCAHCVGRYAVYPEIVHGFMWSFLPVTPYPVNMADRIEAIEAKVSYMYYVKYLTKLNKEPSILQYSFINVRRYIGRWHAGRVSIKQDK